MPATNANFRDWVLEQLGAAAGYERILLRDPLRLLPARDAQVYGFAREHGYLLVEASTNLAFRQLYAEAQHDPNARRLLVFDRTPQRRRPAGRAQAPAIFYPDLLATVPPPARLRLDLRAYLKAATGDPNWPQEANDPAYASLIGRHLPAVLRAHENLRAVNTTRFTDSDFHTIVAYAALGVPEAAFKRLDAADYWKIGLLGHNSLEQLETLTPEVSKAIKNVLSQAPAPFCWLPQHDADLVVRAYYWAAILSQHTPNWRLVLGRLDPALATFTEIPETQLAEAERLIALDPTQAERDLADLESRLDKPGLSLLLDTLKLSQPARQASLIENERYSSLLRSLSLVLALSQLLSSARNKEAEARIAAVLSPEPAAGLANRRSLVDQRSSLAWSNLRQAFLLARECLELKNRLAECLRLLKASGTQLSFADFRRLWNEDRLNRLEYFFSALERLVGSGDLLPRPDDELPPSLIAARQQIQERVSRLADETHTQLDQLNRQFQTLVAARYADWVKSDRHTEGQPILTSQFLPRVLKPHWDPKTEKAVLLIFDGMRYDIWDELLRPMLLDRMEVLADLPGSSLLPSETQYTRKAISAGTFPDRFSATDAEDKLLAQGLSHAYGGKWPVEVLPPPGAGTGETVRYRAGNLDVIIFELCDQSLHHISQRKRDDRWVPARPLAFVYQQQIKDIIDNEVMAILRGLPAGTKVFVTADHGFGRIPREKLVVDSSLLNALEDCAYLNAFLKRRLADGPPHAKLHDNVYEFTVGDLRMPGRESPSGARAGSAGDKLYASLIFPKTGYALARPTGPFNPDAYSHGGISLQELMIPMVVLRVKARDEGLLRVSELRGPADLAEGQEAEFSLSLQRAGGADADDLRVEVEASYGPPQRSAAAQAEADAAPAEVSLPRQVHYVPAQGVEITFSFTPHTETASPDERRQGALARVLTVTVSYHEGRRSLRQARTQRFSVHLNAERVVRRVPPALGNILGLSPKK